MYCVIVGDIINSRGLDDEVRERVTLAAKDVFDRINTEYAGSLMTTFGMVRGDAFEGVMLTQHYAPQIVQDIIKAIYKVEKTTVRISVVMGQLTVTGTDRNETDGPAFHKALDDLTAMKERKSTHWLQVSFTVGSLGQALVDSQFALLTALTEGWTDKQREIVWLMEEHGGYKKTVSKLLDISVTVVNKQLKAAHYDVYRQAWDGLTEYLIAMDEYTVENKPVIEQSYVPYFNMALRKRIQRNYPEALQLFLQSLALAKKDLAENDTLFIMLYCELAEVYTGTGNYDEAEAAIRESFRLQESMPKARPQYIETLITEANLYLTKGDWGKSLKTLQEALSIAHDALDEGHPLFGALNNNLAMVYEALGDFDNALSLYNKALISAKIFIDENPVNYASSLSNMADCYLKTGQIEQARLCAEESLQLYKEHLPPNHFYIDKTRELLANIKSHQGGELA